MTVLRVLFPILIGMALFAMSPAEAQRAMDCARAVADADLAAKQRYQQGMANLIAAKRPEFREVATLNRDLQIALAQARHMQLLYLLADSPRKVSLSGGLSRFSNFSWSSGDDKSLREANSNYAQLEKHIEVLRRRNDAHDDWSQLRMFARGELSNTPEFQNLMVEFQNARNRIEQRLAGCK